jgi:hypothetical protein
MYLRMTLVFGLLLAWAASSAWATSATHAKSLVQRDVTYEQNLRWEASTDQAITPAKVLRWMRGLRDVAVFNSPSPTEFQPIVNVNNSHVRIIAAIAYKF